MCDGAHIAVIANDALGNYVAATPLLQALRKKYNPKRLHLFSGRRTEELWTSDPNIDAGFAILGSPPRESALVALEHGPYDLVVNLESSPWAESFAALLCDENSLVAGHCLGSTGRGALPFGTDRVGALCADADWTAADLPNRYPMLCTGFIGEIFCRIAYIKGTVPPYSVPSARPSLEAPPLLIGVSASVEEKLWPVESWVRALEFLAERGLRAGLLGARASDQRLFWIGADIEQELLDRGLVEDLRGRLTLPEVVGALDAARAVLTLDNGIMHLAATTSTPVVSLFRHGYHRLWAPPVRNLTVLEPGEGRSVASIAISDVMEAANDAF